MSYTPPTFDDDQPSGLPSADADATVWAQPAVSHTSPTMGAPRPIGQGAYGQASPPKKKSFGMLYVGLGLMGLALMIGVGSVFLGAASVPDDLDQDPVEVPASGQVFLTQGTWTVLDDAPNAFGSGVTVTDTFGNNIQLSEPDVFSQVETQGDDPFTAAGLGIIEIPADGMYNVSSSSDSKIVIVRGDILSDLFGAGILIIGGIMFGAAVGLLGLVIAIVGLVKK